MTQATVFPVYCFYYGVISEMGQNTWRVFSLLVLTGSLATAFIDES
jgi:hypothetical protein